MNWHDWRPRDPALAPAFDAWRRGELATARAAFERAAACHPDDPDAWRGLGGVAWTEGALDEALTHFLRALRLDPANPLHWHNVGLTHRDLGHPDRALHLFAVALDLDPCFEPAVNEIGNVLVDVGRPHEALGWYDLAVALDGTRAVVWHNRGVCHRLLGRIAEARADFARALELHPAYHHTLVELSRLDAASEMAG